jgi:hypothetical protein
MAIIFRRGFGLGTILVLMLLTLGAAVPGCYRVPVNGSGETTETKWEPDSADWGFLDGANDEAVVGWVWDRKRPNEPVLVDIYEDGKLLATVKADRMRKDLEKGGKGNGKHGFRYPAPPRWKATAESPVVRVTISGTAIDLPGSPKTVNLPGKEAKETPAAKPRPGVKGKGDRP